MEPVVGAIGETKKTVPVSPVEVGPDPRRWSILAVVVIAQLMVVLDASIVTIALPSIQRALHISVANRQWAITAYTLAFGGLLLLGGLDRSDHARRSEVFPLPGGAEMTVTFLMEARSSAAKR